MIGYWTKSFDVSGATRTAKVYLSPETPIRLRMARLPATTRFAFWFNPRRGTWHRDGAQSLDPVAVLPAPRVGRRSQASGAQCA